MYNRRRILATLMMRIRDSTCQFMKQCQRYRSKREDSVVSTSQSTGMDISVMVKKNSKKNAMQLLAARKSSRVTMKSPVSLISLKNLVDKQRAGFVQTSTIFM